MARGLYGRIMTMPYSSRISFVLISHGACSGVEQFRPYFHGCKVVSLPTVEHLTYKHQKPLAAPHHVLQISSLITLLYSVKDETTAQK